MSKKIKAAASVTAHFCGEHLHVNFHNKKGEIFSEIALEFEDGVSLVADLLTDLEEISGLELYLHDPDDPIGQTVGNA